MHKVLVGMKLVSVRKASRTLPGLGSAQSTSVSLPLPPPPPYLSVLSLPFLGITRRQSFIPITLVLGLPHPSPMPAPQMPCPFQAPYGLFRISTVFLTADSAHCHPSSFGLFSQKILAYVALHLYIFPIVRI